MGKDMMIELLKSQLEASNATNLQLRLTIDTLNATISNLESLLQERDSSLDKARSQMRGMSKLIGKKSEKQLPETVAAMTAEERASEEERRAAERKARGNNGSRRKMHFEMETVEKDVYLDGMECHTPSSTRDTVRYKMIPPRFIKEILHIHTVKADGMLISGKAPLVPLQNSSYDGSFIAGIAQLRYLYSMPV